LDLRVDGLELADVGDEEAPAAGLVAIFSSCFLASRSDFSNARPIG
jgi:hypothetical protein